MIRDVYPGFFTIPDPGVKSKSTGSQIQDPISDIQICNNVLDKLATGVSSIPGSGYRVKKIPDP
jgi:hypothetical protein